VVFESQGALPQVPLSQKGILPLQAWPQPPQLLMSLLVLTQSPWQQLRPDWAQSDAHPPPVPLELAAPTPPVPLELAAPAPPVPLELAAPAPPVPLELAAPLPPVPLELVLLVVSSLHAAAAISSAVAPNSVDKRMASPFTGL